MKSKTKVKLDHIVLALVIYLSTVGTVVIDRLLKKGSVVPSDLKEILLLSIPFSIFPLAILLGNYLKRIKEVNARP